MGLFDFHIHQKVDNEEVLKEIRRIHLKINKIMAKLSDIKTEFDNVKTAIAEEITQINTKLDELQNANDGGTAEERQALIDDMKVTVDRIKSIIPDTEPTPEEPGNEGNNA